MYKQILINVEQNEKRVAILEGSSLEEFYVERSDHKRLAGNIYKGRVRTILPGMGAAFVDLGIGKDGFLHVSDVIEGPQDLKELISESLDGQSHKKKRGSHSPSISQLLKKGEEIIVQVVKEPIGTKGARLTTHISMPGRFVVFMPYEGHIGISKRITKHNDRTRIKRDLASLKLPKETGLIVRTVASNANRRAFAHEIKHLMNLWNKVKKEADSTTGVRLLHHEYDLVLRVVRDIFSKDVNRLIVDNKEEYKKVAHFVSSIMPGLRLRIKYYRGETPLFDRFGLEKEISKLYGNKIYLASGGSIVIEQTEGLVAIDVNTGGFVGKKNLEETTFLTNMEAAKEIARQVRLRDMGGIIVIDFIDMETKDHRHKVFEALKAGLRRDKAKTKVLNISQLGLVEMTRQRMRQSVESISYKVCPYCNGRGSVKSVATVCIEARKRLTQALKKRPKREVVIYLHPDVCKHLLTKERSSISYLENRYRRRIAIKEDPSFHIEMIKIAG